MGQASTKREQAGTNSWLDPHVITALVKRRAELAGHIETSPELPSATGHPQRWGQDAQSRGRLAHPCGQPGEGVPSTDRCVKF